MNRAYDRIGSVFVRGPKAYPIAPAAIPNLIAYIHNNPVRAGVCSNAAASTWSSHRAYVGKAPTPRWLHVAEGLARAGLDRFRFDEWVNDPSRAESEVTFTEEHYARELEAARRSEREPPKLSGGPADAIVAATAEILGLPVETIHAPTRGPGELLARAVAVSCAKTLGVSGCAIASALGLSQQRVSVLRRQSPSRELLSLSAEVSKRAEKLRWAA